MRRRLDSQGIYTCASVNDWPSMTSSPTLIVHSHPAGPSTTGKTWRTRSSVESVNTHLSRGEPKEREERKKAPEARRDSLVPVPKKKTQPTPTFDGASSEAPPFKVNIATSNKLRSRRALISKLLSVQEKKQTRWHPNTHRGGTDRQSGTRYPLTLDTFCAALVGPPTHILGGYHGDTKPPGSLGRGCPLCGTANRTSRGVCPALSGLFATLAALESIMSSPMSAFDSVGMAVFGSEGCPGGRR